MQLELTNEVIFSYSITSEAIDFLNIKILQPCEHISQASPHFTASAPPDQEMFLGVASVCSIPLPYQRAREFNGRREFNQQIKLTFKKHALDFSFDRQ